MEEPTNEMIQNSVGVGVIRGDHNTLTITIGPTHTLAISRPWIRSKRQTQRNPAFDFLLAEACSVALLGRESFFDRYQAWLKSPDSGWIRILTGAGGRGKTRFAIELCKWAAKEGWDAGFLTGRELVRFEGLKNLSSWSVTKPTLLVVDYAAEKREILRDWIRELSMNHVPEFSVRLLLLEREGKANEGWIDYVFPTGDRNDPQGLLDGPPETLPSLEDPSARHRLFEAGFRQCHPSGELNEFPRLDKALASIDWGGQPLFLLMAGLIAGEKGVSHLLTIKRLDLAMALANQEWHHLETMAEQRGLNRPLFPCLAALSTLTQGLTREEATTLMVDVRKILGLSEVQVLERDYEEALQDRWPSTGLDAEATIQVPPLRPDPLGEALLLKASQVFRREWNELLNAAFRLKPADVAQVVFRASQDFGENQNQAPAIWGEVLLETSLKNIQFMDHLEKNLPKYTLCLLPLAVEITQARVQHLRRSNADRSILAGSLNNLANRLSDLGQREEALAAAREAADLHRALAQVQSQAFTPDLATSLNNLANRLSDLGQREEALAAAREAADLYRTLAQAQPQAFTPYLATSLNNLANRLSNLGQREEALAAAREAESIRRALAQAQPQAFTSDLAMSLNNLASFLSELGQREEALAAAREAVSVRRALAQAQPQAFIPDLAISLNNLGSFLSELGQREEALSAAREAVSIHRALAQAQPQAFTPDLAMSLNNLGSFLSELGQREEALSAAREAVSIHRALAQAQPQAFNPDLAMSLNNLASFLSELGQREEALAAARGAVELYRALAQTQPQAFTPNLAASFHNLASFLSGLGQREEALSAAREAVSIRRALAQAQPQAFTPDLAGSLNNLASILSELGQREEALAAARGAVELYRALAQAQPQAFTPNLAASLNNLGSFLSKLGQREEALAAAQEAVSIRRALAQVQPQSFTPNLAGSLNNLASLLSEMGQREEALVAAREAVDLYELLAQNLPQVFGRNLSISRNTLTRILQSSI